MTQEEYGSVPPWEYAGYSSEQEWIDAGRPASKKQATANTKVRDSLSDEELTPDELNYVETLRASVASGQLTARPGGGGWNIGVPADDGADRSNPATREERDSITPPSLEGSSGLLAEAQKRDKRNPPPSSEDPIEFLSQSKTTHPDEQEVQDEYDTMIQALRTGKGISEAVKIALSHRDAHRRASETGPTPYQQRSLNDPVADGFDRVLQALTEKAGTSVESLSMVADAQKDYEAAEKQRVQQEAIDSRREWTALRLDAYQKEHPEATLKEAMDALRSDEQHQDVYGSPYVNGMAAGLMRLREETSIPYVTPALEWVSKQTGAVGEAILDPIGLGSVGRFFGEGIIPTHGFDIAVEFMAGGLFFKAPAGGAAASIRRSALPGRGAKGAIPDIGGAGREPIITPSLENQIHYTSPDVADNIAKGGFRASAANRETLPGVYVATGDTPEAHLSGRVGVEIEVPDGPVASIETVGRVREQFGLNKSADDNTKLVTELQKLGYVGAEQRAGARVYFDAAKLRPKKSNLEGPAFGYWDVAAHIAKTGAPPPNTADNLTANSILAQMDGVANAAPDDIVVVYSAVDPDSALTIAQRKYNGMLTSDPESAIARAIEQSGVSNPVLVEFHVPRAKLNQSKANPLVFTSRESLTPTANGAVDRITIPNARVKVREWLKASELGAMRSPVGPEPIPDDVARVAFGDAAVDATKDLPRTRSDLVDAQSTLMIQKRKLSDAQRQLLDADGNIPPENALEYDRLADAKIELDIEMENLSVQEPLSSIGDQLELHRSWVDNASDDMLRQGYEQARRDASIAQDRLDRFEAQSANFPDSANWEHEVMKARDGVYKALHQVQRYGEALSARTDGKEGLRTYIKRMVEPNEGETGAVRISGFDPLPDAIKSYMAELESVRRVMRTKEVNGAKIRVPAFESTPETIRFMGLEPVTPRLGKLQKTMNVIKAFTGYGILDDPLADSLVKLRTRTRNGFIENNATRATSKISYMLKKNFKWDKNTLRLKGIPDEPTLQTVAAKWSTYKGMLTDEQNATLAMIREELDPYYRMMVEQGIDIKTRADIEDGGFYIPRGRADIEGGIDMPRQGPRGRSAKKGFELPAVDDQMTLIEQGYRYHPYEEVIHTYFIQSGERVLDSHIANILKNATDEKGIPLGDTVNARMLRNQKSADLAKRVKSLQQQVASLSKSIEGLDTRIHGALDKFGATPAPDLDALRNALSRISTRNGRLRVQWLNKQEMQSAFKDLRRSINDEVLRTRGHGKYAGMTAEQHRRAVFKEQLEAIKIRRGRFKGMDHQTGAQKLQALKEALDRLQPAWQAAKDDAAEIPTDQMRVDPSLFGRNLQGYSFDEVLGSALNKYLLSQGSPRGSHTMLIRPLMAANALLRGLRATFDVSFMGIQGLLGLTRDPQSYGPALRAAIRSAIDPIHGKETLGKFIYEFDLKAKAAGRPTSQDWARSNLRMGGIDTEYMIGGVIGKLPGVRQSNRAFGYFGDILRLHAADSRFASEMARRTDWQTNPAKAAAGRRDIAEAINLMTGWSAGRTLGDSGNLVMFAPRFFQSQLELVGKALTNGSMTGIEARGAFRNLIGLGVLLTVAANETGATDEIDYLTPIANGHFNSNFMRIRTMGQDFSVFGPWDSLVRAVVTTASDGDPGYLIRTKASPLMSIVYDQIIGKDFVGNPVPNPVKMFKDAAGELTAMAKGTEYESSGDWGLAPEYLLRNLLPLSVGEHAADVHTGELSLKEGLQRAGIGSTGLKASPITNAEERDILRKDVIAEMMEDGTIPEAARKYFDKPYDQLGSGARKLVEAEIVKRHPEMEEAYREARRNDENLFQGITDRADAHRQWASTQYDKLLQQLKSGEDPANVWKAYNEVRNQLAGRLADVYQGEKNKSGERVASKDTQEYQKFIETLRPNDLRVIEDTWNGFIVKMADEKAQNLTDEDWDMIERMRMLYLQEVYESNPEIAQEFVYNLQLKEKLDFDSASPLAQLKKKAQATLQPYYQLEDPKEKSEYLANNPEADVMSFMTATWEHPIVHSVQGAAMAHQILPNTEIKIANADIPINDETLTILKQYDKEIMQMISLPASYDGTEWEDKGKGTTPRTELRKQDPLYDALYFWMGFSKPSDSDKAKGINTVPVYNYDAVIEYLKQWGARHDGVMPRKAK